MYPSKFALVTPEKLASSGTEHGQQAALFCWAATKFQLFPQLRNMFAIPNGGWRNPVTASKLKVEGVRAGVPDIFLAIPSGGYHGLFIEMKADKGRISNAQLEWFLKLEGVGYRCVLCKGWQEAVTEIEAYLQE